jgi:aminomuconate-semialdehyde/2-hydroxymuconate-6-semialdehyde dehydrogenase
MLKIQNYLDGALSDAIDNQIIDNFNPSKGVVYGSIPNSNEKDVEKAVKSAEEAFPEWGVLNNEKRFKIMNRIAELIDANRDELAKAESMDQGKPLWLAKNEMIRAAQNMRFFATAAMQYASDSHIMPGHAINYTQRHPLGVVACISPWNLPLYLFTWKIAPALATGNCVIAKPSEITPATAFLFSKLCIEAGLPKGVLNILHGTGPSVGGVLVAHPRVKAISFTGGTNTGRHIASVAAPMFKKLSLELGGKNPNIIFDDADLDKAIATTVNSSFMNQGEICLCGSRIYVHRKVYDQIKQRFVEEVSKLKIGDPLNDQTKVGAIVSKPHFDKILGYIDLAKQEGATILTGGHAVTVNGLESGWYIAPTILEGLGKNSVCNLEEIFGPVVTLTPFDSEEEVLELANSTEYGLAATLWTQNLQRAHRMASKIESGIVWINCWLLRDLRTPFGGMKNSGVGREGGFNAMNFFTEQQNVCVKL